MSLRRKLMIGFISILCFVFAVSTLVIINRLIAFTLEDQKSESDRTTQQTASAVGIVFSDIETALRQSYSDMRLAQYLSDETITSEVRRRDLVSKLRYICYNSNYFDALLLIDEKGHTYVGAKSLYETEATYKSGIENQIENSYSNYTDWFRDENGHVYVKKDVYSVTPLYRAGILIARLNDTLLTSLLGYSEVEDALGISSILYSGSLILSDKPFKNETAAMIFTDHLTSQNSFSGFITIDEKQYWLAACNAPHSWYVIRLLEKSEMLRSPNFVMRISIITVIVCALFSAFMSWVLCRSLTASIHRLNQGMDKVGNGDFSIRIANYGNDEIGQLTKKFDSFVEQLSNTTRQMVSQATAKKQMELEIMDLKYRSLQAQISPHFICNILASIKGLYNLDRKNEVIRLLVLTSKYLRNNLNSNDIRFVAVLKEVTTIQEYLQIYEQVYEQRIILDLDLPEDLEDSLVPSLLLLPLVENSIQHGGFDREMNIVVKLRVCQEGENLAICLSDQGSGIPAHILNNIQDAVLCPSKNLPGFGIQSVLMRLRLLYGENQRFHISSHEGYTSIRIVLPHLICDTSGQTEVNL